MCVCERERERETYRESAQERAREGTLERSATSPPSSRAIVERESVCEREGGGESVRVRESECVRVCESVRGNLGTLSDGLPLEPLDRGWSVCVCVWFVVCVCVRVCEREIESRRVRERKPWHVRHRAPPQGARSWQEPPCSTHDSSGGPATSPLRVAEPAFRVSGLGVEIVVPVWNRGTELEGSEEGSYLRSIDFCITQL